MSQTKAKNILDYLVEHKMGFCFLQSTGGIVSREDCLAVLEAGRDLTAEELLLV